MTGMAGPAMRMARSRFGGLIAVFCAVLGGAAILTAVAVLGETGIRSHPPVSRLAAADLLVSRTDHVRQDEDVDVPLPERGALPAGLGARVAAVPGVDSVTAGVSYPAALLVDGRALAGPDPRHGGHGWSIATLGGPSVRGDAPRGRHELALDSALAARAHVAPGDEVTARVAGRVGRYRVAGVVAGPGAGLYLADPVARAVAGHPHRAADLLAVRVRPGTEVGDVADRLRVALGDRFEVTGGAARGDLESPGAGGTGELVALSGALSGTVLLLVGFIVAGALSVSVANQRRDLALLRATGATPRQVRRLVALQASAVTAAALIPGIGAGYLLARGFADLLVTAGMLAPAVPLAWSPIPALLTTALLGVAVQLAARAAARRTSRIPVTEALAESRVEPREPAPLRTVIGSALIALALASTLVPLFSRTEAAFVSASSGTLLAIVGLALVGPALVRAVTGFAARRRSGRISAPAWLALSNSHSYALRTAGAITVLALAVSLTLTQVFTQTTLSRVVHAEVAAGAKVDATITGAAVGGPSDADRREVARLPGVRHVVPMVHTTLVRRYREEGKARAESYPALALGHQAESVLDPEVVDGDLSELRGDSVAMDATAAWIAGLRVGDEVPLSLADGTPVTPRLVATYRRGFGFGRVLAATDLLRAHSGRTSYDALLVDGPAATVAAWAGGRPGLAAAEGADGAGLAGDGGGADRWVNTIMSIALLGYILLGVANSLIAATSRRRAELATLRLVGATPEQVARMMRIETWVTGGLAVAAGFALSLVPMTFLGLGFLGRPWPQGPLWLIPAIAALVCLLAQLATTLPTRRALSRPPTALLAAE